MREVLAARSDRDFVAAASPRRRQAVTPLWWRLLAAAGRHPGALFGGLVAATATAAVAVNALTMQTGRHPAPLFAPQSERAALPAARPAETLPLAPTPPARPAAVHGAPVAAPAPARTVARDPIGDLIKAGEGGGTSAEARSERTVAAAQRALNRLGYGPLKEDGLLGAGTGQAIERFERDRRLGPTGSLGPRTLRELAAHSGVAID